MRKHHLKQVIGHPLNSRAGHRGRVPSIAQTKTLRQGTAWPQHPLDLNMMGGVSWGYNKSQGRTLIPRFPRQQLVTLPLFPTQSHTV